MSIPKKTIAPYGKWRSPITEQDIAGKSKNFTDLFLADNGLYWVESNPHKKTKQIFCFNDAKCTAITPRQYHIGNHIMSYGGASFSATDKYIFFSDANQKGLFCKQSLKPTICLINNLNLEVSNVIYDDKRNCLYMICEDQTDLQNVENYIGHFDMKTKTLSKLIQGQDFYSSLKLNPAGKLLCWISWQKPNMPWNSTTLVLGHLNDNGTECIALEEISGGPGISVQQPQWDNKHKLFYISDHNKGWWNIFYYDLIEKTHHSVYSMEADFGQPCWISGISTYCIKDENTLYTLVCKNAIWFLAEVDIQNQKISILSDVFAYYGCHLYYKINTLYFCGSFTDKESAVIAFNIKKRNFKRIRKSNSQKYDASDFAIGKPCEYQTSNNQKAHAFLYKPTNREYRAPSKTLPPLLIKCHGGPTSATSLSLNLKTQYWASRGYMVADVNYRGSTSYGREYRESLYHKWGDADVDDCIFLAKKLIAEKKVDPQKIIISGGSAGGYLVLNALIKSNIFSCAAVYYGLSDLIAIRNDGEKFEADYDHFLIGPFAQCKEKYHQYSPINHIEKINCPTIFFHGEDDRIVPKNQTEIIVKKYKDKDLLHRYFLYPHEGHGFNNADTIEHALKSERQFYEDMLDF